MKNSWKKNLGVFSLSALCFMWAIFLPNLSWATTIIIPNYNPVSDDNNVTNKTLIISGANGTIVSTNLSVTFVKGDKPEATRETLNDLNSVGKVADPNNILGERTLALGSQNFAISIPDPITGTSITIPVYNTGNIALSANTIGDRNADVFNNVNDMQYIDISIAKIDNAGGTMNVELGNGGSNQTSSANHLELVAKQSTLFKADGTANSATVNWNTNNRVSFSGVALDPSGKSTVTGQGIPTFSGTFSFTSQAGNQYTKTVTDEASLKNYNDWLISELKAGTLKASEYKNLFDKAVTLANKSLTYEQLATQPDEIFEPLGDRIILKASGEKAVVNIKAKLEGQNATTAVKLEDGANLVIENTGSLGNTNGAVITMNGTSATTNNGVINANFLTDSSGVYASSGASNVTSIIVNDKTSFTNNGIFNIETNGGSGNTVGLALKNNAEADATSGYLAATDNLYYSAGNSANGIINVGVSNKSSSGSTTGVLVDSPKSSFINEGEIYLGRASQNNAGYTPADTAINQKNYLTGIKVQDNGQAVNTGSITINSEVQNGVAMFANGGQDTIMQNKGIITLNDNSGLDTPNTNYGMLVQNAGASGGIEHLGTINLNGINGVGLKVISTGVRKASASTAVGSLIDIKGASDAISGTRNYGVWVEGLGRQKATAKLEGEIKLEGDGAIGIHARGQATIDVSDTAIPQFISGTKQIGFFAYGEGAEINLSGGNALTFVVETDESTVFRVENGADLSYLHGLEITTKGEKSKGIVASGESSVVSLSDATFNVTGKEAIGVIVEGGAVGDFVSNAIFNLDGDNSVGILVDGEKHDLADRVQDVVASQVKALVNMVNDGTSNVTGLIVKNISSLVVGDGSTIKFLTGTNNTGIKVESGSTLINNGSIEIAEGLGISVSGEKSVAENKATIEIDTGTGMFITDKAVAIGLNNITVNDGVAGVHLSAGGILNVSQGTHAITTDGTAHGILLDTGTLGILVTNTTINVQGSGHGIENKAETQVITLNNTVINVTNGAGIRTAVTIDPTSTATVNVAGSGIGFAFVQEDMGTLTTGDLLLGPNYTFNVNGANGTGILALTTSNVITSGNVNVTNASGGSALVAGTAKSTLNLGKLESLSTASPVVDLSNSTLGTIFENQGTILAASNLEKAILGSGFDDALFLSAGEVRGDVFSGEGNDTLQFTGGTLEGSLTMGNGENKALVSGVNLNKTSHIISGNSGKNALILENLTVQGSTMAGGDDASKGVNFGVGWNRIALDKARLALTGDLLLDSAVEDAELFIGAGSALISNNGVQADISSLAGFSTLKVTNYGLIDLTTINDNLPSTSPKFQDTLDIYGNYVGGGELYLDTYLNEGGRLTNQETDRLFIHGNASQTTLINFNLTHAPGMDSGAGTDFNGDGIVQSNEGISIVQVIGNASENSFKLKNGYVASGAFSYNLYSFDHNASDTSQNIISSPGNPFYDFRLANKFVEPLTRPQVTPQVPAYVSTPMANVVYSNLVIDDLHKRLGELRYNNGVASGDKDGTRRGFLRYIGGKYDYNTNIPANNFGYDFELSFNAMQLGFNLLDLADELNDGLQAGISWTHGRSTVRSEAKHDGYSKAKIDADTVGLYATYQHEQNLYFDAVLSGTWSRSKINTDVYARVNTLKSFGWSASVESGYSFFPLENKNFKLEPQAQLTYYHEKTKDSVDADGAVIKYENNNQLFGRLGLRAAYEYTKESGLKLTPYAIANYYTNFGSSTPSVNISNALPSSPGYNFNTGKFGDSFEGGLGLTVEATNSLSVYTEVDYRKGINGNGLDGWRGDVGLKLSF